MANKNVQESGAGVSAGTKIDTVPMVVAGVRGPVKGTSFTVESVTEAGVETKIAALSEAMQREQRWLGSATRPVRTHRINIGPIHLGRIR